MGTSRRAASSTSATRPCPGSAYRTALLSTGRTPRSTANPRLRAASLKDPLPVPPTPCHTTSTRRASPKTSRQFPSNRPARSGRPAARARPTSESGPNNTTTPSPRSASQGTSDVPPPPAWAALTMRQSSAHPRAPSRARKVTRGADSSTKAPPRTGARSRPPPPPEATAATPRSTPKTGRTPLPAQALANRTAPASESRSARASTSIPRSEARRASRSGCEAPYRSENPEATRRCANVTPSTSHHSVNRTLVPSPPYPHYRTHVRQEPPPPSPAKTTRKPHEKPYGRDGRPRRRGDVPGGVRPQRPAKHQPEQRKKPKSPARGRTPPGTSPPPQRKGPPPSRRRSGGPKRNLSRSASQWRTAPR